MMKFKEFLAESFDDLKDVNKTLDRLPKQHRDFVKDFKFIFQSGNNIKGDAKHVGLVDVEKKIITISGPYFYSREWVILHELAHLVWKNCLTSNLRKKWTKIATNTKVKLEKDVEELFCFAYSQYYAEDKPNKYHKHAQWRQFIKKAFD